MTVLKHKLKQFCIAGECFNNARTRYNMKFQTNSNRTATYSRLYSTTTEPDVPELMV